MKKLNSSFVIPRKACNLSLSSQSIPENNMVLNSGSLDKSNSTGKLYLRNNIDGSSSNERKSGHFELSKQMLLRLEKVNLKEICTRIIE